MIAVVAQRAEPAPVPDRELDAALALAARGDGLTFIAVRAPLIATNAIVAAWPDVPLVAWSSDGIAIVGVGIAHELRSVGVDRWSDIAGAARALRINGAIIVGSTGSFSAAPRSGASPDSAAHDAPHYFPVGAMHVAPSPPTHSALQPIEVLGFARPRFLGGGAFAPSAADAAPWTGFGDAWFVLPRWTYVNDGRSAWLVVAVDPSAARETTRRYSELAAFRAAFASAPGPRRPVTSDGSRDGSTLDNARALATTHGIDLWRAQVEAITSAIANGDCTKVVAARTCSVALSAEAHIDAGQPNGHDFESSHSNGRHVGARRSTGHDDIDAPNEQFATNDAAASAARVLATLEARHADCVRVLVRPPGGGTLVAATPERLVSLDRDEIRCDALAGTVRLESPDAETRLRASDKDRREHAIVVDAVRGALETLGAHVDAPTEPAIKTLRHVLHLHTPIRATAPRDPANPLHLLDLAARLHPTPAVGGTPTAFALDWIRDHEPVPRGWYASPVGWFDLDGNGELAVAIRSGVLVGNRAHLWAGAGIVAGSDPDRELAETELKLRAMLGALRGADGVEP